MKFGNIVRVENLRIFNKDHDAAEESQSQTEAFAMIATYNWWQSSKIKYASRIAFRKRGGSWSCTSLYLASVLKYQMITFWIVNEV